MFTRRHMLHLLASAAALAGVRPAVAGQARIDRLIEQSSRLPSIGQRIEFISRALIGARYRGYTLIGGPHRREQFVLRDDCFDCVTYCETVLAAAIARKPAAFAPTLRAIRYHHGVVEWRERNHYFFEWSEHNIANGSCRAVTVDGMVTLDKTVSWHRALGRRHFAMHVVPRGIFLASRGKLLTGDIVGFVTRRPNLDYFHVGFVVFGPRGEFLLRHASKTHGRVLDEHMARFVAVNHVRYVTLLRPLQPTMT
jgi:N-acetylmuramoyl-L-alanine amidase-like